MLRFYFRPVLHGKPNVVFAVDRHEINHAVEKQHIVFCDGFLLFFQNLEVVLDGLAAGILVMKLGGDRIEPFFCLVVAGGQAFEFLIVIRLILRDVGVLINAVLNEPGDDVQLIGKFIPLFFQRGGVKGSILDEMESFKNRLLIGEHLVCGANEGSFNLVVREMRRGAFLAVVLVVALPGDLAVFIGRVSNLRAVPAAALAVSNLAGEVVNAAVAVPSRTALLKFSLHLVENVGVDDSLVIAFDVILRNLALVDLRLFGQVIDGVGFLQERVAFVLLI